MDMFTHGGDLRKAEVMFGISGKRIIDFSASINPLGLPPGIKRNIIRNIESIVNYPDPFNRLLTEAIMKKFNINRENIINGNGSNELIYILLNTISPKKVIIPAPSYSEYERAALAAGAGCVFYDLLADNSVILDPERMLEKVDRHVKLVFICNPHNPTGNIFKKDGLENLIERCMKKNVFVLIDEAFMPFVCDEEKYSLIGLIEKYENLAVLRSLTKIYAIPGLRLGFLLGSRLLVEEMKKRQSNWQINSLAQEAGPLFLENGKYLNKSKIIIRVLKDRLYQDLKGFSWIRPYYPAANFIFCRIKSNATDSGQLREYLVKKHGILIRDCSDFRGLDESYIRLAVKREKENNRLIRCLREFGKGL